MLDIFRKHATSWLIKAFFFLIAFVFIFWGGYSYKTREEGQIAKVGDQYISVIEYNKSYQQMIEMFRRQMGGKFNEDLIRQFDLKKQALETLVDRIVLAKAAEELGLGATAQEIQARVFQIPAFQTDGRFDKNRYVALLQQNRMTPESFEQSLAEEVAFQKLEDFIKRRAIVTEAEIEADFLSSHTPVQLGYVILDPKSFEDSVKGDEQAVKETYEKNQDRYKDPERRQFAYISFKTEDFLAQVPISDDEIRQHYEENQDEYHHEAEVRAKHILFSVKEDAPEQEVNKVRAEAQKVLDEARKGRDFTELAKSHSQDPSVAQNAGDLGFFSKDQMVEAFSEVAFSLKPGQISELTRTPFGFHIIKVEEARPEKTETLEEVRQNIERALKEERAHDLAYERARAFGDLAFGLRDIAKAAQSQSLEVKVTDSWLTPKEDLPGVGGSAASVMGKLFTLADKDVSDVLDVPQGFVVVQVQGVRPPEVLPLEQVKERVEKDYRAEQARRMAKDKASELLEAARKKGSLESAAGELKMEMRKTEWFTRKNPDKDLRLLQAPNLNEVFELDETRNPFPASPYELGNRTAVVQLLGKKAPAESLEKERSAIAERVHRLKENMVWQSWKEEQRKKVKVEVLKEL